MGQGAVSATTGVWIEIGPAGGGGTPLLLLHGFLGCAADWSEMLPLLARGRRCIAVDLPGHGRRPEAVPAGAGAFEAVADGLGRRLEERGVIRFDVLGYSLGGRLTLALVCRHPDRVRRAVAVGASPGLREEEARARRRERDEASARRLEAAGLEAFLEDWYAQPIFREFAESPSFAQARARRREGDAAALAAALRGLSPGAQPYLGDDLARSEVPLLLVAGARDDKYVAMARALAEVSGARSVIVPGAGHAVHLERPDALAEIVTEFLDEGEE